jgi:hypothetical protein
MPKKSMLDIDYWHLKLVLHFFQDAINVLAFKELPETIEEEIDKNSNKNIN